VVLLKQSETHNGGCTWQSALLHNELVLYLEYISVFTLLINELVLYLEYISVFTLLIRPLQLVIRFLVRASSKSRGGWAGLVIMSLFHFSYALTLKLHIDQSRWTQLLKGIINIV